MTRSKRPHIQVFPTTNLDEQLRAPPHWAEGYQQMSPGAFSGLVKRLDLSGVEVFEEQMNIRIEQDFAAPENTLAFCFDRTDNSLFVLNEGCHNIWITPENYQEVGIAFGPEFMRTHGLDMARLDGLFMTAISSPQITLFSSWLSTTLSQLARGFDTGLSEAALASQLLDDCLYILDSGSVSACHSQQTQRIEARRVMRRMSEWANDTPQDNVNLVQLATIAGCSLRKLQSSFRTHTGISPSYWLRLRRLNGARRELLQQPQTTIAEVAMRWSFWHLGRFSHSYRMLFKELPRETQKRAGYP